MKIKIKELKNIVIVGLVLLAAYQTGQLWFGNLSDRNFFYSLFDAVVSAPEYEEGAAVISPYRLVTGFGNKNSYQVQYSGVNGSLQKKDCDAAIVSLLQKGEYAGAKEIDGDEIFKSRSHIYEYPFQMPSGAFSAMYGHRGGLLTSRFQTFQSLAIIPSRTVEDKVRFCFINWDSGMSYEYTLENKSVNDSLNKSIQGVQNSDQPLFYVSSRESGFVMFANHTYIPQWAKDSYTYQSLSVTNPYVAGELLINDIAETVSYFFSNSASIYSTPGENGVYTYSNENTVVKYYPYDVLEYASYKTADKRISPDFLSAYRSAIGFIKRDQLVVNDYYLAGYETAGGQTVFYFDYTVNNLPVVIPWQSRDELGISHALEVTVENDRVVKYKKLAYQFETSTSKKAGIDFVGALNSIFGSEKEINDSQLEGAVLGYKLDGKSELTLYWFLQFEEGEYIRSAQ